MKPPRPSVPGGGLSLRGGFVIAFAIWLLISAFGKFSSLETFHEALRAHALVPRALLPFTTWAMPILELSVGALAIWRLLTTGSTRAPAVALLVVFVMLTAYTTVLAIRPPAEPAGCGCGLSRAVVEHWWPLAVRNGVAAAILVACALGVRVPGAESPAPRARACQRLSARITRSAASHSPPQTAPPPPPAPGSSMDRRG